MERTTLQVSDDPKRLFIAVDLKTVSEDVKDGQNYEVKVNSGKIVLQLLPDFDGDKIKSTISSGIEKTDFKTKKEPGKNKEILKRILGIVSLFHPESF